MRLSEMTDSTVVCARLNKSDVQVDTHTFDLTNLIHYSCLTFLYITIDGNMVQLKRLS